MSFTVVQNKLRDEVKQKIMQGFARQAIQNTGINGLSEESISFEIFNGSELVGALVVQPFWGQLHIKYLFVSEPYRSQGIGRQLMQHALTFAEKSGMDFAFVETMCFQASKFYQKMGFEIEFSREGYAKDTTFHYLKKSLKEKKPSKKITRIGVYGVARDGDKLLLIQQKSGPYACKYDLPGGGMEFGETPEQTLRREFSEEIGMEFDSCRLINNISAVTDVSRIGEREPFTFFQIGMIYEVKGLKPLENRTGEFQPYWMDIKTLSEKQCSPLLWKSLCST